jgi:hypothetical protein
MTLCINESFFKRLTLLQAETPAVTRLGELPMSLFGKRLRPRHQIARCKMRCPGRHLQQGVCHRAGRLVMPCLHWSQRLPRENKCSSRKDLSGSAVSQTVSSGGPKIDSSDLEAHKLAYNLVPIRKLRIGIFARVSW